MLAKKVGRLRVAGDLFHFPEVGSPAMAASRMVRKVMALANELGIEWEVMAGNHDLHGNYSALDDFTRPRVPFFTVSLRLVDFPYPIGGVLLRPR